MKLFSTMGLLATLSLLASQAVVAQPTNKGNPKANFHSPRAQDLSPINFQAAVVDSAIPTLVLFYSHTCSNSRRLIPTWKDVTESFQNSRSVQFAEVDCTWDNSYKSFCKESGIKGYPTPMMFVKGKAPVECTRYESTEEMTACINSAIGA
ncbi:hypothetical protein IWQ62_005496 [Dispira parvispora]|uniref:Thioredoxin domain-containing protein n=1 Tax=Dispira parvispora TaxID=1520584 RepID=A0A9W8AQC8_9FUNG|nr:hypothetical protein IWQ62_005496 [Dispira parvispora]